MDLTAFRQAFPEFSSSADYPDALILLWSSLAESSTSVEAFGSFYDLAVYLCTAHNLCIAKKNSTSSTPGTETGVVTQKKVGELSISYDVNSNSEQGSGFYNQTSYGKQYFKLVKIYGTGAIQV